MVEKSAMGGGLARVMCLVLVIVSAGVAPNAAIADGGNSILYAVPAPLKVNIDGDLADWDTSGMIVSYPSEAVREKRSIQTCVMYDQEAFYLAGRVTDDTPMMNAYDPVGGFARAWQGDSIQFRMYLKAAYPVEDDYTKAKKDPPHWDSVHILAWYHTGTKQPCLDLAYSFHFKGPRHLDQRTCTAPSPLFNAAYKQLNDNSGYSFEYRIPWTTLSDQHQLKAGDVTAATLQAQWGTGDGMQMAKTGSAKDLVSKSGFPYQSSACWGKMIFSEKGNLSADLTKPQMKKTKLNPLVFKYEMPTDGVISLALLDKQDRPVRHIVTAEKRLKGSITESWDGLDDKGDFLEPGEYHWKAVYHKPLKVEHRLSVHNSGSPPYPTEDGKGSWGADHGLPTVCACAGNTMLLGWNASECGWSFIGTSLDGVKQWGQRYGVHCLTADNKNSYLYGGVMGQLGLNRMSLENGWRINFSEDRPSAQLPLEAKAGVSGLAVNENILIAACPGHLPVQYTRHAKQGLLSEGDGVNRLALIDKSSGALIQSVTISGQGNIGSIALCNPKRIYAVLGGTLVTIDYQTGELKDFAAEHIDEPVGLAVDSEGNLYVSNRGKLQNVSVFTNEGRYLRSIGKTGGRPAFGKWLADGMIRPEGIAIDSRNQLWVAENTECPKRYSVWDTKSGRLVKDYFGGSEYSAHASMDPEDITRVYCHGVQWKVDMDKGTWYPEAVVAEKWRRFKPFTANNGFQYAISHERKGENVLMIRLDGVFEPIPAPRFFAGIDKDLRLFGMKPSNEILVSILEPRKISEDGAPEYNLADIRTFGPGKVEGANCVDMAADDKEKAVYLAGGGLMDKTFPGFNKFSYEGVHLWGYWKTHPKWKRALDIVPAKKGQAIGVTSLMGLAGDFVAAQTYFGAVDIWTRDGIYLDQLYNKGHTGEMTHEKINAEWTLGGANFVKTIKEGRYFLLGGDSDGRVNEVIGLETVKYFEGTYQLTDKDIEIARKALDEDASGTGEQEQKLVINPYDKGNWDNITKIDREVDEYRSFRVGMAYSKEHLIVHYEVDSPYSLTNMYPEIQHIFKGGNVIDIEIATNEKANPQRTEAGIGDIRLLITRRAENPICVAYFKKVDNFRGKFIRMESPTGEELFDIVEEIPVEMDYSGHKMGFTATVKIPLSAIGLKLKSGDTVRMDVGYRFGNVSGSQVSQRIYWKNRSRLSAIKDDIPSELRMEPANWAEVKVR